MKKILLFVLSLFLILTLTTGCAFNSDSTSKNTESTTTSKSSISEKAASNGSASIVLSDMITVDGTGASTSGNTVTISAGGSYSISGTLKDGQVV